MTKTPQTTRCRVRINVTGQGQHQCEEPAVEGGYCAKHQSAFSRQLIPPVPAPSAPARAGEPTRDTLAIELYKFAEKHFAPHRGFGFDQEVHDDALALSAKIRRALAPATAEPTAEAVEESAKLVYAAMQKFDNPNGQSYPWVERGNSLAQDEARRTARAILASRGSGPVGQGAGGEVTPEMVERFRRAKFCEAHQDREFKYGRVNIDTNIEVALKCDACIATALRAALAVAPAVAASAEAKRILVRCEKASAMEPSPALAAHVLWCDECHYAHASPESGV